MAKKKKKNKQNKGKKSILTFKTLFFSFLFVIGCILYLPSVVLLFVGMLPTLIVYSTDNQPGKNKTFTIGALNFSGCFYYLINIWGHSHPMDRAVDYLSDPMTIVVIYSTAALGYLIDYMATLFVSSILRQKSLLRLEKIEKEKKKLEGRWGTKVNGERRLDDDGFPLDIGGDASDSAEESA